MENYSEQRRTKKQQNPIDYAEFSEPNVSVVAIQSIRDYCGAGLAPKLANKPLVQARSESGRRRVVLECETKRVVGESRWQIEQLANKCEYVCAPR